MKGKMSWITNPDDFVLDDKSFLRDEWSGRYYRLDEPSGFWTKAAREGGLVKKRISKAEFTKALEECRAKTERRSA